MCVMEMIYHVHLTKTDFKSIKHLWLTQACFKALATALFRNDTHTDNDDTE